MLYFKHMESIEQISREIKEKYDSKRRRKQDIALICIVLFIGISSFSFGFLAGKDANPSPIRVGEVEMNSLPADEYARMQQNRQSSGEVAGAQDDTVVGSVNSDKYHAPWCSSAQRINEENKRYFASIQEARNAGYQPAGNCEGLE